jgi:hypothetical protein
MLDSIFGMPDYSSRAINNRPTRQERMTDPQKSISRQTPGICQERCFAETLELGDVNGFRIWFT